MDSELPVIWSVGACEAGAVRLSYRRTGACGPSLVALHGLMGSGASWTGVARALGGRFDLIAPDARGHGRSAAPAASYRYEDHADDVCRLIAALGLTRPILIGHSMGGMTAAVVASRLGASLGGVVLVDPTFISPDWQEEVYASDIFDEHRRFLLGDRGELIAQARARHPARTADAIEIATEARLATDIRALEVLAPPNPDYRTLVAAIRAPTLLVLAERGVVSVETAQDLGRLNDRVRHAIIADVGHPIPSDAPEPLAAAIEAFAQG